MNTQYISFHAGESVVMLPEGVKNEFILPKGTAMTGKLLREMIDKHKQYVPKYLESKRMYENDYGIMHRQDRAYHKPDNRLTVNLAKYIVDTFNGFFMGNPVKESHENEQINKFVLDFNRRNNLDDHEAELSKIASIYGHAFEYIFQDENAETEVVYETPLGMFIIYDDTIKKKPMYAVRYDYDEQGRVYGELITHTDYLSFKQDNVFDMAIEVPSNETRHYYGGLPVIEYLQNSERQSIFENVKSLINALNKVLSAKVDDIEYFADAYLAILGAEIEDADLARLLENRVINLEGDGADKVTIQFLEKPSSDTTQENTINWLLDLIYQTAMVSNVNDEKFSNASGTALEIKLQPMSNLALTKERKFKSAMQNRYKLVFNLPTNVPVGQKDEWQNIKYTFTQNMPRNISDEVENARNLEGIVSKETQLSQLSFIGDAKEEMDKLELEKPDESGYDFQNFGE